MIGAAFTLTFAPFNLWYLALILMPSTLLMLAKLAQHKRGLFWPAWWFGLGYFGVGISWVHVSIAQFGGIPLIASLALMLLLCGYLALFPALTFYLLQRFFKLPQWPLALPLLWLFTEYCRAHFLTGFPWLSIGYSQTNSILSEWMPIVGEIGLSALLILASASLAIGLMQKRYYLAALPMLTLLVSSMSLQHVAWTSPNKETRSVALVQGNIEQSMRWQPELDQITIDKYLALTEPFWGYDLIIWPEAAIPKLEIMSTEVLQYIDNKATATGSGFVTGVVDYNINSKVAYNSLISMGIDKSINSEPYRYQHNKRFSKHHLLPIGEFVPFENLLRPLAPIFDLPMSSFTRGDYVQSNLIVGNTQLSPAICFEIAFPKQVSANISAQSDAIITVSNDAWFGDSHGPHQHLQIAQARAKEFGLPVLRATNNGVTAVIDHQGNISHQIEQFTDAVLHADIRLTDGATPYQTLSDIPIWVFTSVLFAIAIFIKRTD